MSKDSQPDEDDYHLMILKHRLAKGEIIVEEFDRLEKLAQANHSELARKEIASVTEKIDKLQKEDLEIQKKSTRVILLLSALCRLVGILGAGHFYTGSNKKGIPFLLPALFLVFVILLLVLLPTILIQNPGSSANALGQQSSIPSWVKNNAKWWSQGQVGDSDFEKGIEYLIDQKIINIPSQNQTTSGATQIPVWVKNTVGMWADGKISDNDFLRGIEYLVQIGIIQIHISSTVTTTNPTQIIPTTPSIHTTPPTSTLPTTTSIQNATNTSISTPTNLTTTIPTKPASANSIVMPITNPTNQANVDSLVGDGVNLKIKGNSASGTLILAGIRYNAPSLIISKQGNKIQLFGNIQTSNSFMLNAVGVSTNGTEYNFFGVISDNGNSTPVKFTALLNEGSNQPAGTASNQPTSTTNQPPTLPMLVLYAQSDHVTMGYLYSLAVKIFDPKANPDKAFDQFYGGISDVNINGTILDNSNHAFASFSGKTDSKGLYQYQVLTPYYQGWQQIFKVIVNATKMGYTPQFATMQFVTIYPNQGGTQHCAATIPSSPTGLTATAVSSTQINLSWTASTGATGYNILRGPLSGPYTQVGTSTSTSFSDTGLTSGTTYNYVVQATNCAGTSSNSAQASATTTT